MPKEPEIAAKFIGFMHSDEGLVPLQLTLIICCKRNNISSGRRNPPSLRRIKHYRTLSASRRMKKRNRAGVLGELPGKWRAQGGSKVLDAVNAAHQAQKK
ncbi:hypothetical protein [Paenibacillus mendelii]|uniref:Uncharacterized protein n=1 Tax=Paenibacillus mendelii TaxID=206163 RepID=A0ABV6JLS3_9BACL|nr:hypothetical protein [Paenibacillus mendelii]MCQ6562356.1 hypothetical protein [Paenibacillus mendelii]